MFAAAVEGVTVTSLTDTSVTVSWNAVIIPDFPIDSYTVVYSPVSESDKRQDGEITAAFPGSVTSGVITDLEPAVIYWFQVFATITVDGVTVKGEWSNETCKYCHCILPLYTGWCEHKILLGKAYIYIWFKESVVHTKSEIFLAILSRRLTCVTLHT